MDIKEFLETFGEEKVLVLEFCPFCNFMTFKLTGSGLHLKIVGEKIRNRVIELYEEAGEKTVEDIVNAIGIENITIISKENQKTILIK